MYSADIWRTFFGCSIIKVFLYGHAKLKCFHCRKTLWLIVAWDGTVNWALDVREWDLGPTCVQSVGEKTAADYFTAMPWRGGPRPILKLIVWLLRLNCFTNRLFQPNDLLLFHFNVALYNSKMYRIITPLFFQSSIRSCCYFFVAEKNWKLISRSLHRRTFDGDKWGTPSRYFRRV